MNTTKWIAGGALLGIAVVVIVMAEGSVDAQRPDGPRIDSATAAADMLEIRHIIAQYSYTFDSRNAEGWSRLFTEDAVWEFIGGLSPEPMIRLEGRDQILAWARMRHGEIPENINSYHHQSGISFEALTPDTARTRVMVLISAHDRTETPPRINITLAGVYHDEWRKTSEGWRFSRRILKG